MNKKEQEELDRRLAYAIEKGNIKEAEAAVNNGADVNGFIKSSSNGYAVTPFLIFAVKRKKPDMIKFLLDYGADVNIKDVWGATSLHYAVWNCPTKISAILLSGGADVNSRDAHGYTPFYTVLIKRNRKLTNLLAAAGADPNIKDKDGNNAINLISSLSFPFPADIVRSVIKLGSDINVPDNKGETPLMKVAALKDIPLMKILLSAGADIRQTNIYGMTAIDILKAETQNDSKYAEYLEEIKKELPSYHNLKKEDSLTRSAQNIDVDWNI